MSDPRGALGNARFRSENELALLLMALTAGAVVALLGAGDVASQVQLVAFLGLLVPVVLLFLVRPHWAIAAYLFGLPLVVPVPVAFDLNAGEAVTIVMLSLGTLSLWEGRDRVAASLRALAPIAWPMAALIAVSLVSLVVNGLLQPQDIVSALFKVVAFSVAALLVHLHASTPARALMLLRALVLGATAVAVYACLAYLMGWSYSEMYDWNRPMGTLENWNLLGSYMALMSMPTLGLAARTHGGGRILYGLAFVLQISAMLLSLTLGSLLGLVVGGFFVLAFLMRGGLRRVVPAALVTAIPIAIVMATNPLLRDKIANIDERVLDRLRTYAVGLAMFRDKALFGFGTELAVLEELQFGEADYGLTVFGASSSMAHNSFIQIGVEKGIFGALVFSLVIVGVLRLVLRDRGSFLQSKHRSLYLATMAGIFAFLVQNLTNVLVLHARVGILFFALVVLVERLGADARREAGPIRSGPGSQPADTAGAIDAG